jgi:hypothetical protein
MAAAVNVRCSPVVGPLAQLRSSAAGSLATARSIAAGEPEPARVQLTGLNQRPLALIPAQPQASWALMVGLPFPAPSLGFAGLLSQPLGGCLGGQLPGG